MSTLCLAPRRHRAVHSELPRRRKTHSVDARAKQIAQNKLQQIEDAVLATILDRHPRKDDALGQLMNDIAALPAEKHDPMEQQSFTPRQLAHMRELLVAVARGTRDRRDRALHALLSDIDHGEQREREAFDAMCDNDPDGLA